MISNRAFAILREGAGHAVLAASHWLRPGNGLPDGYRVLCLHGTAEWARGRLDLLLEKLDENGGFVNARDFCDNEKVKGRFLLTFDDGYDNNAAFAERLAERGISAIYFVVPSFVGRTTAEYLEFHRSRGVEPFVPVDALGSDRGLSGEGLNDITAMGHIVGAHNFAHRSLGSATPDEAIYEIDRGIESLEQTLGRKITEFALAFGFSRDVNEAARNRLQERGLRTYTCLRGWTERSGDSRLVHRTGLNPTHPWTTSLEFAIGRMDWATRNERDAVEHLFGVSNDDEN